MREVKIAKVIDHTECVIVCGGWSISFLCELPLDQDLVWEHFHGNAVDHRPRPRPPNFETLRRLKPLSREERHAAKKRAFGVLEKKRSAAREKARVAKRRQIEEPTLF